MLTNRAIHGVITGDIMTNINKDIFEIDKPLFIYSIDVSGLTKQRASEFLHETSKIMQSDNANIWVLPCETTDVKCIWGSSEIKSNFSSDLNIGKLAVENLMKRFAKSGNFSEEELFKITNEYRNIMLDTLLNDTKN